jgi:hypothetical protein
MTSRIGLVALALALGAASPVFAQRVPFEQTFTVPPAARLEVTTDRGKIDVSAGEPGRIVVNGEATVRVGWTVPSDAIELARQVAAHPPASQDGATVRLGLPADTRARDAVTVSYSVRVPPGTAILSTSESGATSIGGAGAATVRTGSAAIRVSRVQSASITTGSGAVTADAIAGALAIETSSSAVEARGIAGDLRVRTSSGSVHAALTGRGTVDVETGSSAIDLRGVAGALRSSSRSGTQKIAGTPSAAWTVTSGSGSVSVTIPAGGRLTLEATSRSGSVRVDGFEVRGEVSPRRVSGAIGGGGPRVQITAGSGSIRIAAGS